MKIAIIFFSGTGNTYYVAKQFELQFHQLGCHCDLFRFDDAHFNSEMIRSYDLIGFGAPVYGSSVPSIVKRMMKTLQGHQECFTFVTQMMYSGDGAAYLGRLASLQGFQSRYQIHFNMPNSITDLSWLSKKNPSYQAISKRVTQKVSFLIRRIQSKRPYRLGSNPFSLILGLFQRVPYEHFDQDAMANLLKIDQTRCIQCSRCVDLCPVDNLYMDNQHVRTKGKCEVCYRCLNHCPTQAIRIVGRRAPKYPYHGPTADFRIDDLKK